MNSRILKKLSKRAAPLLTPLGCTKKHGKTESRGDASWQFVKFDKKHKRNGDWIDAFKGTPWVGSTMGYEEPEWEDAPAYEELKEALFWITCAYPNIDETGVADFPTTKVRLCTPTQVFKAAASIINQCNAGAA